MVVENPLLRRVFPAEGSAAAVLDTGYEGFLALPRDTFHALAFDQLQVERRTLVLANGSLLRTEGAYGTLKLFDLTLPLNGFVETYKGLDEVLVGTVALTRLRILLDYCAGRVKLEACR